MSQKIAKEDEKNLGEITEIGCMCTKCNCKKIIPLVISICDFCRKDKHTQNTIYN